MNTKGFRCVIMLAWTVETSDCRNAVAFFLPVRPPVICGQQGAAMRSIARLSKADSRGRNTGRRVNDAVEIMQVWKADSSINEDVRGVRAEAAVKVCDI